MKIGQVIRDEFDNKKHLSGIGGVESGRDAAEFLLLGANSVQVSLQPLCVLPLSVVSVCCEVCTLSLSIDSVRLCPCPQCFVCPNYMLYSLHADTTRQLHVQLQLSNYTRSCVKNNARRLSSQSLCTACSNALYRTSVP